MNASYYLNNSFFINHFFFAFLILLLWYVYLFSECNMEKEDLDVKLLLPCSYIHLCERLWELTQRRNPELEFKKWSLNRIYSTYCPATPTARKAIICKDLHVSEPWFLRPHSGFCTGRLCLFSLQNPAAMGE